MNKARSTILALVAILMTPMAANADLIQRLDLEFRSGNTFHGLVAFDEISGAMLDVSGTLYGAYGDNYFDWTWLEGNNYSNPYDYDGVAVTLEDYLMNGYAPNYWTNWIALSWFWNGSATLNLNTNYAVAANGDRIVRGKFSSVPEPGTLALFSLGLLGIGAAKRRKAAA